MRQLQKERVQMQNIHNEYLQWKERKDKEKSEKRRKKNQERIRKKEEKKETLKFGEDERTIPPRYRDGEKTPPKKTPIHPTPLTEQKEDSKRHHDTYVKNLKRRRNQNHEKEWSLTRYKKEHIGMLIHMIYQENYTGNTSKRIYKEHQPRRTDRDNQTSIAMIAEETLETM